MLGVRASLVARVGACVPVTFPMATPPTFCNYLWANGSHKSLPDAITMDDADGTPVTYTRAAPVPEEKKEEEKEPSLAYFRLTIQDTAGRTSEHKSDPSQFEAQYNCFLQEANKVTMHEVPGATLPSVYALAAADTTLTATIDLVTTDEKHALRLYETTGKLVRLDGAVYQVGRLFLKNSGGQYVIHSARSDAGFIHSVLVNIILTAAGNWNEMAKRVIAKRKERDVLIAQLEAKRAEIELDTRRRDEYAKIMVAVAAMPSVSQ